MKAVASGFLDLLSQPNNNHNPNNKTTITVVGLLSQPNNNHNPNNKTTITVVGLRLSNRWEPPPTTYHLPTTTTQTQNYMIEQK